MYRTLKKLDPNAYDSYFLESSVIHKKGGCATGWWFPVKVIEIVFMGLKSNYSEPSL